MCQNAKCNKPATIAQWDCCDNYNFAGYYCSSCSWQGGSTDSCSWQNFDLQGNLLAQG